MRFAILLLICLWFTPELAGAQSTTKRTKTDKLFEGKPNAQRYQKVMNEKIGARWYALVKGQMKSVDKGSVTISFSVDKYGQIRKVQAVSATPSSDLLSSLSKRAVLEVKLDPFPPQVLEEIGSVMKIPKMTFEIY